MDLLKLSEIMTPRELGVFAIKKLYPEATLQEIGDSLGVTRQRAHQYLKIAKLKFSTTQKE